VTPVSLAEPVVIDTTIAVTMIAKIPSPTARRAKRRPTADDPRTSSDPATTAKVPKISANEGIQTVQRRAKGANASPRAVAGPISSHRERRVVLAMPSDRKAGAELGRRAVLVGNH
jgi:hypothetical protein